MYLSIIIPAYNEENNIINTINNILRYLKEKEYSYEIIVVDDGSKDNTYKKVEDFLKTNNCNLVLLRNQNNEGKGSAIKKGVMHAQGDFILFLDADYATPITELDKMLRALKEDNFDFVIGSRYLKGAKILRKEPLLRIILGKIYHFLAKVFILRGITDYNCGFKLFQRDTAQNLFSLVNSQDYTFDAEILFLSKILGYRFKEVPVNWTHQSNSKVKPFRDGLKAFFSLIKIRLNYFRGKYKRNVSG